MLVPLLLWLMSAQEGSSYVATVEVELFKFETLNEQIISEGTCCDSKRWFKYNPCDFRFLIQNCSRPDRVNYNCSTDSPLFSGGDDNDTVTWERDRPFRVFVIQPLPRELVINITVIDDDSGWTKPDFVGNYILRFDPRMISRASAVPGTQEHIISIPGHSRLTLFYRAYCNDADCQDRPPTAFDPASSFRSFDNQRSRSSFNSPNFQPANRGGNLRWSQQFQREQDQRRLFQQGR